MTSQEAIEAAAAAASAAAANKVALATGLGTSLLGFLNNNILGVLGLLVAVVSAAAQIYFRRKELRIKQHEHRIAMKEKGVAPVSDIDEGI